MADPIRVERDDESATRTQVYERVRKVVASATLCAPHDGAAIDMVAGRGCDDLMALLAEAPTLSKPLAYARYFERELPAPGPERVVLHAYTGQENLHIDGEYAIYRRTDNPEAAGAPQPKVLWRGEVGGASYGQGEFAARLDVRLLVPPGSSVVVIEDTGGVVLNGVVQTRTRQWSGLALTDEEMAAIVTEDPETPLCQALGCDREVLTTFGDGAGKALDLCEDHGDLLAVGFALKAPLTHTARCTTCDGKGLVSLSGRGSDGPDPCPDCRPEETGSQPQGGADWVTDDRGRLDDGYGDPLEQTVPGLMAQLDASVTEAKAARDRHRFAGCVCGHFRLVHNDDGCQHLADDQPEHTGPPPIPRTVCACEAFTEEAGTDG